MATKRKVEIFSAGCALCESVIDVVERIAGPSDEVLVHDLTDPDIVQRAMSLGIHSVPAVVIDGKVLDSGRGVDEEMLRSAGLGKAI
jgi:hypothetical protein